jgi:hypothetical protein
MVEPPETGATRNSIVRKRRYASAEMTPPAGLIRQPDHRRELGEAVQAIAVRAGQLAGEQGGPSTPARRA